MWKQTRKKYPSLYDNMILNDHCVISIQRKCNTFFQRPSLNYSGLIIFQSMLDNTIKKNVRNVNQANENST